MASGIQGELLICTAGPLTFLLILGQIWDRLGLRLVPSSKTPFESIVFSIEHPDLTSGLVAPKDAFTARLLDVSCEVDFSLVSLRGEQNDVRIKTPRQSLTKEAMRSLPDTPHTLYNALGIDDQKALDDFMLSFKGEETRTHGEPPRKRLKTKHYMPVQDISSLCKITETILEVLIQGGKRTYAGFRLLERHRWPGLLHVAPGVFHIDYLKVSMLATLTAMLYD